MKHTTTSKQSRDTKKTPKRKIICSSCRAPLGIVMSMCRCKRLFCYACIQPEVHSCENLQDFADAARKRLEDELMSVRRKPTLTIDQI